MGRVALEALLFRSLWRGDRLGWGLAWCFHAALLVVLVRHLWLVVDGAPAWLAGVHFLGHGPAAMFAICALGLLARRVGSARHRYISIPSDYLWLALFIFMAASGVGLGRWSGVDLTAVREWVQDLVGFSPGALPTNAVLVLHILGACVLLALFPFSKLFHAPAVFITPTWLARGRAGRSSERGVR